ncbi:MAG: PilZ domain-containing protein [Candidatus Solibacter usitatus]|nr:PilZ domain-containing protein [Candidatus Solibacter usitatus]
MLCADLVDVRWKDTAGRSRRAVANLEDISLSGACLQLDSQVPLNTLVRISYPKGEFSGMVRYCVYREIGYFVGVQFDTGCKWEKHSFKPLHLLDPRTLAKKVPPRVKSGPAALS